MACRHRTPAVGQNEFHCALKKEARLATLQLSNLVCLPNLASVTIEFAFCTSKLQHA